MLQRPVLQEGDHLEIEPEARFDQADDLRDILTERRTVQPVAAAGAIAPPVLDPKSAGTSYVKRESMK